MSLMNIALDYDKTYTLDPAFWDEFIRMARWSNHRVYIVTLRSEEHDRAGFHIGRSTALEGVVWCDGRPKKDVVAEKGIRIDIWIDDQPESVSQGSGLSPDQLAAWRAEQKRIAK